MSVPQHIDRYRVRRRLGSGAFATVWLADDDLLESSVAVKVLADNWAHQLDVRARFLQEARILRRADSDRLVRVLDAGELPDGRPYMVMTHAAGGTLAERLAPGPMPVRAAVRIAADIARGVSVLHRLGVIHRDLKPSNVLFGGPAEDERVLVADLGLAKAVAHASGFTVMAGSPGYMAPEQARPGGGLDVRADVYAIGALTYHMLTGRPPHLASSIDAVRAAAAKQAVRPSKLRPGVPTEVDDVVLRALHPDPDRRWPSALAFAEALDKFLGRSSAPRPQRSRRWLRRVALVPAAVSLVAVLAAAGSAAAPGWVRVSDASGDLSVTVPAEWARQLKDSGWNPSAIRLPAGHAPGLLVGTDLTAWSDPASGVPGVFVGASQQLRTGGEVPQLPSHNGCTRQPDREYAIGLRTAKVHRWTRCHDRPVSFSEVLLVAEPGGYGIYLQVKQVSQTPDHTEAILRSLRVPDLPTP